MRAKNDNEKKPSTENSNTYKQKSKDYKQTIDHAYKHFHKELHRKLRSLKSKNPKDYWQIINNSTKQKEKIGQIALETFMEHFKKLNQIDNSDSPKDDTQPDIRTNDPTFQSNFTDSEILKQVKKLKNGKACGIDFIINEFIKNSPPEMITLITKYFNVILDSGIIPSSWCLGIIVPIYKKKGDINDVDNYRGITLLSCIGKLFTMVLNARLCNFLEDNNLLNETQAGFREDYSTLDHIFSLHCLIDILLSKKKRVYTAFVDYKKAFDSVDRCSLWSKLINLGIKGKVFTVIKNMYENAKSCIRLNGQLSEYFNCNIGVRQGENLSPLLFSIFLNDLEDHMKSACTGIKLSSSHDDTDLYVNLFVLLYADDTILVSESPDDLQKALNSLHEYCCNWKLTVNASKTKIVVFSRGKVTKLPTWTFGNEILEVQDDYTYLGTIFNFNGKFNKAIGKQITQAKKALYTLIAKARKLNLPIDIQCHLFDTCIVPILLYGSEVWGFADITQVERVQTFFCKYILKLHKGTANCITLGELGRYKLDLFIKQRMLNFWARLVTGKTSKIAYRMYNIIKSENDNGSFSSKWLKCIKGSLENMGLGYVWMQAENIDVNAFKYQINLRLTDTHLQNWFSDINESSHCHNYKIFKTNLNCENYLTTLDPNLAIPFCKYRCGNHRLPNVDGRYKGIDRQERKCPLCKNGDIGDEFHYIMTCSFFRKERDQFIDKKFTERPNTMKFRSLFNSNDLKTLSNLAKFAKLIMKHFSTVQKNSQKKPNKKPTKKKQNRKAAKTKK